MAKIKIDSKLYDRAKKAAQSAGYSSLEEFITSIIEKEVAQIESPADDDELAAKQLRGLGYID
ncbi:MAG: hypothetical protein JXA30_21805 [Deltaproteobacteria bacterium]|nr:hypothetical protein [Deltaproteobacteria bacterium]